jgi:hypothetical protein
MGLFQSKKTTYAHAIAADIERGLVARYLARILERGDLPLRSQSYCAGSTSARFDELRRLGRDLQRAHEFLF